MEVNHYVDNFEYKLITLCIDHIHRFIERPFIQEGNHFRPSPVQQQREHIAVHIELS